MKLKRSAVAVALCAIVLSLLVTLPSVIMPVAAATVTTYANNTFESYSVGATWTQSMNSGTATPSLAKIEKDGSNRVLKLETVPATAANATRAEYLAYGSKVYNVSNGTVTIGEAVYPVTNGKVTIDGKEYTTSTSAREYEARFGGGNVDRNVIVANSAIPASAGKVYLQTEYFISEDARGSLQSQFMNYTYDTATETGKSANWLSLFYLLLDSGEIRTDANKATTTGVLTKGAWNTVTVVFDLATGVREIYVNNRYVFTDSSSVNNGYKNFSLTEKKWIVAKLNKDVNPDNYAGYVYIDDAKILTCADENLIVPAATDSNGNKLAYIDVKTSAGEEFFVPYEGASMKFVNPGDATLTPAYFDVAANRAMLAPVPGASIRLTHAAGIRFATQLDLDMLEELLTMKKEGKVANVSIGTVITPKSYVDSAAAFTMEDLDSRLASSGSKYINVKGTIGHYYGIPTGVAMQEGMDTCFVGSITNVKLGNRATDFSAIGYVKVDLFSGESAYIYSYDYVDSNAQKLYSRSVKGVAEAALADDRATWTEDQRLILASFFNGAENLTLSNTSIVKDLQYTANEFFFRNAAGVYCRLTYEGANGWRLQANGTSYDGFDEMGAGQALAGYLGEFTGDKTERLVITSDANVVKISSPSSSTYVTLNYTGAFNLQFYNTESNSAVSNVNAIEIAEITNNVASTAVTLKGSLVSGEAVYGGGERFDVVNKRGTSFQLYTQDGWNSASASYMAIPLFVTSRGAGMFINRYENMSVDFGKTASDSWAVTLNNDLIDCYFYATGKISDALFGYTEISGHSSLPEEWAQGELICRYSPDLSTFEDRTEYVVGVALESIADYGTTYYIKRTANLSGKVAYVLYGNSRNTLLYTYDETCLYNNSSGSKLVYYKKADGLYYKAGPKGNPGGHGVKTIVQNLIDAGMKPTAVVMEAFGWSDMTTNSAKYAELKKTVEWLDDLGIKSMFYMGVGSISGGMTGYKSEYQVWANMCDPTTGEVLARTYRIPKTSGTGVNPDVGSSSIQQYVDVTNPQAVEWYMNTVWGPMIDLGVDGIKIDFCECMPDEGAYSYTINDVATDVNLVYDWYDPTVFEGDEVHHAYSTYFISVFYKSMIEQKQAKNIDDGFVVLSRGGGIGSQRNPYLWEGDQARTFAKIEDQLIALINSGISGVPFMTYDLAGYAYSGNGDSFDAMPVELESRIFARAIEYSAFTSNIQSHGDVRHAYQMTEETQEIYRNFTNLHEELIPYIQKYSKVACDSGMPVVRHMILNYQNDANVYGLETQYMFGDALLVAPITTDGATTKSVYLPEGNWLNLLTGETVSGGKTVTVNATLGQIPVFMNTDCDVEDKDLLADVFNGKTWTAISGIQLEIENEIIAGDPWLEDPFVD